MEDCPKTFLETCQFTASREANDGWMKRRIAAMPSKFVCLLSAVSNQSVFWTGIIQSKFEMRDFLWECGKQSFLVLVL